MRIAHKFTLTLVACVAIPIAVGATVSVRAQLRRFEDEIAAHQVVIGRAVLQQIVRAWRAGGRESAYERIADADARYGWVDMRWVWLEGAEAGDETQFRTLVDGSKLAKLRAGDVVHQIDRSYGMSGRIFTYVPVTIEQVGPAALEVSQPLDRERDVLRSSIQEAVTLAVALIVLAALAASALGVLLLGRPMRELIEQAKRVGQGDLAFRIAETGNDELGTLAHQMNRMCDSLATAQEEVASEADARLRAVELLRHTDRLATVGRLAAGLAHELGTPINVAQARIKPALLDASAADATRSNAAIALEQLDRMSRLIRRLLNFARVRPLDRRPTDVRAVATKTAALLAPLSKKHQVPVVVESGEEPITARVDATQLEQVVTNLVVNAIHASPEGSPVTVDVRRESAAPPDGTRGPTSCVCLEVRDRGAGIGEADMNHIFEPFFTTKEVGSGTGLGLSIAYGIVRDHGGWIDASSARCEGSCFRVYIPEEADG